VQVRTVKTGQAVPGRVCAAKQEKYYGFKVLMNSAGEIFRWWPANIDEREMLDAVVSAMSGLLFADKGLISADLTDQLAGRGVDLTTPLRANMTDDRPPWLIRQAMRLRRGIETACLVEDFGVLRNKGRDFWRARFLRKVLAYNLSLRFERTFAME
jgi:Transposase DDE domain